MITKFKTKNYGDNKRIERVITSKLEVLNKFVSEDTIATVMLKSFGKEGEQYKFTLEISIQVKGQTIRSEHTSYNMWDNIDIVIPKLESQLTKIRKKKGEYNTKPNSIIVESEVDFPSNENYNNKIVKVKNYNISIITPDQAIEEMELLDHSFYVFLNAEDNKVSVVYKRMDGNYGLISPEY